MLTSRVVLLGCLLLIVAVLPGCGESKSEIKGTVTYQGKPLNSGSVLFQSAAGEVESAPIQGDGSYVVTGLSEGPAKISVSVSPPPQPGPDGVSADEPGTYEPNPVLVPKKYHSVETSGLEVTVAGSEQTHDIQLD